MRATSITLTNLRNHGATALSELSERINVLAGPNGAGKTSVLEALSLTTVTKSFTTHTDAVLIRKGQSRLEAQTAFVSDLDVPMRVDVSVELGPPLKKSIFVNSERLRSAAELVGRAPVVVLTPDDKSITSGSPGDRRRFLNMVLSQASRSYLDDESEYRKALKHRNAVLTDARTQGRNLASTEALLHPWTELVIKHGARIMARRSAFTKEFGIHLVEAYQALSEQRESPSIRYLPMGDVSDRDESMNISDLDSILRTSAAAWARDELRRGTTLFGPHRDEVAIEINAGQEARLYASQGQHKTLLVAMKVAEYEYLREATQETPIMLLDDVFSELDARRAALLIEYTQQPSFGQTFITTTDRGFFERTLPRSIHKLWTADRDSQGARIERAEAN